MKKKEAICDGMMKIFCTCGCGYLKFERVKNLCFVSGHTHQNKIRNYFIRLWKAIFGKDYCCFEIVIDTDDLGKLIEFLEGENHVKSELARRDEELKITDYNDAVSAGKISVDVKRDLSDAEIEELGAQEAERKEFCPNCEADVPCTHEAELFVCDICGEDFAKYVVSRNCSVSDVSVTPDVLIDIKTPRSIAKTNPDYYKHDTSPWISIANGRLPEKFQKCIVLDRNKCVHNWIHDDVLLPLFAEYTHWMPLPEPPEEEG